jgi:hypothetical protein
MGSKHASQSAGMTPAPGVPARAPTQQSRRPVEKAHECALRHQQGDARDHGREHRMGTSTFTGRAGLANLTHHTRLMRLHTLLGPDVLVAEDVEVWEGVGPRPGRALGDLPDCDWGGPFSFPGPWALDASLGPVRARMRSGRACPLARRVPAGVVPGGPARAGGAGVPGRAAALARQRR